jgi:hypothetical protein
VSPPQGPPPGPITLSWCVSAGGTGMKTFTISPDRSILIEGKVCCIRYAPPPNGPIPFSPPLVISLFYSDTGPFQLTLHSHLLPFSSTYHTLSKCHCTLGQVSFLPVYHHGNSSLTHIHITAVFNTFHILGTHHYSILTAYIHSPPLWPENRAPISCPLTACCKTRRP